MRAFDSEVSMLCGLGLSLSFRSEMNVIPWVATGLASPTGTASGS
jgi:hypothetical protein